MKARYVTPPLDEARVARQWSAVRSRLPAAPSRRRPAWTWGVAFAAAVVGAVAAVVVTGALRSAPSALTAGAVLETGTASDGAAVSLADGSRLSLEGDSRVTLVESGPARVRVAIERGGARVEATHVAGRSFVVEVAGHEVRVTGTAFVVRRLAFAIEVAVDEGEVEVTSPDGSQRGVRAGETWSAKLAGAVAPEASVPLPAVTTTSTGASTSASVAPTLTVTLSAAPPPSASADAESAKSLFDEAQRARAAGRSGDAARALDKLRRTFRRDPRAALAAFDLGRLRLDALGDPRGAEEALRDAIALGPASPFREDAEARRVQALARLGDTRGCAAARDAYLSRYPSGVYRKSVGVYCGGP